MESYKERLYIYGGYCKKVDNQEAEEEFNLVNGVKSGELFELVPKSKALKRIHIKA